MQALATCQEHCGQPDLKRGQRKEAGGRGRLGGSGRDLAGLRGVAGVDMSVEELFSWMDS